MQNLKITKEEITGTIGAIIFLVLLLVILLFSYFTIATPPENLEGIPVMFGNFEDASGYEEPPMNEITPVVEETPTPPNIPSEEPLIAQVDELSIVVEEQKRKEEEEKERQEQARLEEQRRQREEAERKKREEEQRKRAINQEMSGLFGENTNTNRGETEGEGTQGVSTGSSDKGASSGKGGIGSYDLGGRSVGSGGLIEPKYTVDEEGTVVVNITVDPRGNVIDAEIGRGTNTGNTTLRQEAIKAARSTKFNSISTLNNQQGTITYKFNLN